MKYWTTNEILSFLRTKPYLLLILATIFWGGNFVVARDLVQTVPPIHLSITRLGLGFLLFLPFAWQELKDNKELMITNWKRLALLAITGVAGFNAFLYVALQTTTSINASLVNATTPLVIVILSALFLKDYLSTIQYLGILISSLGVLWAISGGVVSRLLELQFNPGDILVIIAVILWAIYAVLMRKWGGDLPRKSTFLCTLLMGFIALLPFFIWERVNQPIYLEQLTTDMWLGIIYIAIFPTILAFVCWNEGVLSVGPSRASNYLHLIVVFTGVFALFIGEKYTSVQFIAAVMIIGGVLMASNPDLIKKLYRLESKS